MPQKHRRLIKIGQCMQKLLYTSCFSFLAINLSLDHSQTIRDVENPFTILHPKCFEIMVTWVWCQSNENHKRSIAKSKSCGFHKALNSQLCWLSAQKMFSLMRSIHMYEFWFRNLTVGQTVCAIKPLENFHGKLCWIPPKNLKIIIFRKTREHCYPSG